MEDSLKSIKAYLYERANSPLLRTFLASWSIWNYKLILVLLSNMDVKDKIEFIPSRFYPDHTQYLLGDGFLFPLLTTIIYIFIIPFPAELSYWYTQKMQRRLHDHKKRIEGNALASAQEVLETNRRLETYTTDYTAEVNKKDEQINKLNQEVNRLKTELDNRYLASIESPPAVADNLRVHFI